MKEVGLLDIMEDVFEDFYKDFELRNARYGHDKFKRCIKPQSKEKILENLLYGIRDILCNNDGRIIFPDNSAVKQIYINPMLEPKLIAKSEEIFVDLDETKIVEKIPSLNKRMALSKRSRDLITYYSKKKII